jgi:hypothetical protein
MKKKNIFIVLFIFCIIILLSKLDYIYCYAQFQRLRLNRRNREKAQAIAEKLSKYESGLDMCIKDMSLGGGSTRTWSSWALIHSKREDYITPKLTDLTKVDLKKGITKVKAIEANYILWRRTGNNIYLLNIFCMVRKLESGDKPITIEFGRRKLWLVFLPVDGIDNILEDFNSTADKEIEMSPDEFNMFCEKHKKDILRSK